MSGDSEERCRDTENGTMCVREDSRTQLKRVLDGCRKGRHIISVGVPLIEEGMSTSKPGTMAIKSAACAGGAALELNQKRQKTTHYL